MTAQEKDILDRINKYAEEVLGDIDPQKTKVSKQLDALMPKFEEIAKELHISLEDMFIKYMDLQSEASVRNQQKMEATLSDLANDPENGILFR